MDNKLKSGKVKEFAQVYTTRKEQITVFFFDLQQDENISKSQLSSLTRPSRFPTP